MWRHGCYRRRVRGKMRRKSEHEQAHGEEIRVLRYRCRYCRHTCASLPSCVAPRRWYVWKVQETVLMLLLRGAPLNECARRFLPSRRTAQRWWRWLEGRHIGLAFHLRSRWPDLGRATGWCELWWHCLSGRPLSEVMAFLSREGVAVP